MKKSVLVTGLSGLIGSRFKHMYEDAYDFINLDLTSGIDITNPDAVNDVISSSAADSIIHLAAFTNVSAAYEQTNDKTGLAYMVNVVGTENIARAAQKSNKYLIHISTDYVYDGTKQEPYIETDAPNPIEWYGQTKYLAEQAVTKINPQHVILRLAYPYQAKPSRPDFLMKTIENLTNNTLPPAFANHTITPTFADDVAEVFNYCLTNRPAGLYHMVGSSSHTDYDIAILVKRIFNLPGEVKPGSLEEYLKKVSRPYQKTMQVSSQKLQKEFSIHMSTLEEGLNKIKAQL